MGPKIADGADFGLCIVFPYGKLRRSLLAKQNQIKAICRLDASAASASPTRTNFFLRRFPASIVSPGHSTRFSRSISTRSRPDMEIRKGALIATSPDLDDLFLFSLGCHALV